MASDQDQISVMSDADRKRIGGILIATAAAVGGNVNWGAGSFLDVWITEHRMRAEREATERLVSATHILAWATVGLVIATVALVVVTLLH